MSAHILLNLSNKLGKRDKAFYLFFLNKFNKFNNTGAWMLDSTYHDIKNILKSYFLAWKC